MWNRWGDINKKHGTVFHFLRQNLSLPIMTCSNVQLAFSITKWTHRISGTNYIWKRGLSVFWKWTALIIQPGLGYEDCGLSDLVGECSETHTCSPFSGAHTKSAKGENTSLRASKVHGLWNLHIQAFLFRRLLQDIISLCWLLDFHRLSGPT